MNRNKRWSGRILWLAALLFAGAASQAQEPAASLPASGPIEAALGPWPETDTVKELLRRDAAAALVNRRYQQAADWLPQTPRAPVARPAHAAEQISLSAIYGVGRALWADIRLDGRQGRYRVGQTLPTEPQQAAYVLVAIEGRCVRLRKSGASAIACLDEGRTP